MKIFLILVILFSSKSEAQVKREVLNKQNIGGLECSYTIETENNDTSTYISLLFRNEKYRNIRDLKVITLLIGSTESKNGNTIEGKRIISIYKEDLKYLNEFLENLKNAYKSMGGKMNLEWKDKIHASYSISLYDFSTLLFINADRGYTTIGKPQVITLINWLSQFSKTPLETPVLILKNEKIEAPTDQ